MCRECDLDAEAIIERDRVNRENQVLHDRTPRIDIDLLDEVWKHIEIAVLTEGVRAGLELHDIRRRTSLDGWNQHNWRSVVIDKVGEMCGTAMCFAGWTAHIEAVRRGDLTGGWLMADEQMIDLFKGNVEFDPEMHFPEDALVRIESDGEYGMKRTRNETPYIDAEDRATLLLGLSSQEASVLFSGSNQFMTVERLVIELRQEELMRRARFNAWTAAQKAAATPAPAAPAAVQDGDVEQ